MIYVERLYNSVVPRAVVTELWEFLADDSPYDPADYEPRMDDDSRWYATIQNGQIVGVYWLRRVNHITWEIHANVFRHWWGKADTVTHGKQAVEFAFADTGAKKLVAQIPSCAPQVLQHAAKVGFKREGLSERAFQRNGKLYDIHYLGIGND